MISRYCMIVLALLALPGSLRAQSPAADVLPRAEAAAEITTVEITTVEITAAEISAEEIATRLKELDGRAELDPAAKAAIGELYQQAARTLQEAESFAQQATRYQTLLDDAPRTRDSLKAALARGSASAIPDPPQAAGLDVLEPLLTGHETELKEQQDRLSSVEIRPQSRQRRRAEIGQLESAARQQRDSVVDKLQATTQGDTPQTAAEYALLRAQKMAFDQRLRFYQAEVRYYDGVNDLIDIEREDARARVAWERKWIDRLSQRVTVLRQELAERQAREARSDRLLHHDNAAVRTLAETNQQLAQRIPQVAEKLAQTSQMLESLLEQSATLRGEQRRADQRVAMAGLTDALGRLLQRQRRVLPDPRAIRRELRQLQANTAAAQWELFDLEDNRENLDDLEQAAESLCAASALPTRGETYDDVVDVLRKQREYVTALAGDYQRYLQQLDKLETAHRELLSTVDDFAEFIDRRIFWVRSASALDFTDGWTAAGDAQWVAEGSNWSAVGQVFVTDAAANPAISLAAVVVLAALAWGGHVARRRLSIVGEAAARSQCYEFLPTIKAVAYTVLISTVGPSLVWYVGWRLTAALNGSLFAAALGFALQTTAVAYFLGDLLRHTCRARGLAEAHFGWAARSVAHLRSAVRWLMVLELPLILLIAAADTAGRGGEIWRNSLGRLAFIIGMIVMAAFAHRLLRPSRGIVQEALANSGSRVWKRLGRAWYIAGTGLPLLLAAISAGGYHYTASQLAWRLNATVWLGIALVLSRALVLRWVLVARRRLAMQQARERRAALQAATSDGGDLAPVVPVDETSLDLSAVDLQTRHLLRAAVTFTVLLGGWFIWSDALPALGILRDVKLRRVAQEISRPAMALQSKLDAAPATPSLPGAMAVVPGSAPVAGPSSTEPSGTAIEPLAELTGDSDVSLAHLLLAVAVAALTLIANKNVPGLLEISILQRLPLEPAGRYAITTLARYVIILAGLIVALGTLGVGWSKVQWLAAAITFGLGFGLQEIFANLVSGVIILFERPIRLGDTVTVGEVSGTVTRIRMRATTITTWDRQELIVPNRDFITGRVVNWTLSDPTQRLVIKLGVAYGVDTSRVQELLLSAAQTHPHVLRDPAPTAYFEAFGESSLDFTLRVFLPSLDKLLVVRHDLLSTINQTFLEAGIDIAYPQRDVHIKVDESLAVSAGLLKAA